MRGSFFWKNYLNSKKTYTPWKRISEDCDYFSHITISYFSQGKIILKCKNQFSESVGFFRIQIIFSEKSWISKKGYISEYKPQIKKVRPLSFLQL